MSNEKEIRELFKKHDVGLAQNDVWTVQSSYVVKHKALERLAAALRIQFDPPTILRAERDEAVILVVGHLSTEETQGDGNKTVFVRRASEWSIGEALVNANYRVTGKMAPYVYAMAEKRAKDRVILKLAGLHGVYSEDEADDFKELRDEDTASDRYTKTSLGFIESAKTADALRSWWEREKPVRAQFYTNDDPNFKRLKEAFAKRGAELAPPDKKEAA